jgi:hypothetical protein
MKLCIKSGYFITFYLMWYSWKQSMKLSTETDSSPQQVMLHTVGLASTLVIDIELLQPQI